MKIITISREFGSGGREIGKRLADELGVAYYDREIISEIAQNGGKADDIPTKEELNEYSLSFGQTFSSLAFFGNSAVNMMVKEQRIIRNIAKKGEDFIIVGRSADVILKKFKPCNIFVYADMPSKIKRCKKRFEKGKTLTEKEIEKKIKQVDNSRKKHHDLVSTDKWGDKKGYNLMVNTTGVEIKSIVMAVKAYTDSFFENRK